MNAESIDLSFVYKKIAPQIFERWSRNRIIEPNMQGGLFSLMLTSKVSGILSKEPYSDTEMYFIMTTYTSSKVGSI